MTILIRRVQCSLIFHLSSFCLLYFEFLSYFIFVCSLSFIPLTQLVQLFVELNPNFRLFGTLEGMIRYIFLPVSFLYISFIYTLFLFCSSTSLCSMKMMMKQTVDKPTSDTDRQTEREKESKSKRD